MASKNVKLILNFQFFGNTEGTHPHALPKQKLFLHFWENMGYNASNGVKHVKCILIFQYFSNTEHAEWAHAPQPPPA